MPKDGIDVTHIRVSASQQIKLGSVLDESATFNPGFARFKDQWWVATRTTRRESRLVRAGCIEEHFIGLMQIDEEGALKSSHTILRGLDADVFCPSVEDARLVPWSDTLFLVYNAVTEFCRGRAHVVRTFLAEIDVEDPNRPQTRWRKELTTQDIPLGPREKNWTPFVYEGEFYFIQQTNPPIILRLAAEDLEEARSTTPSPGGPGDRALPVHLVVDGQDRLVAHPNVPQPWRGGTPAIYDEGLDEYVSFFHFFTSPDANERRRRYYGGFYTFAPSPPFSIRRFVPEALLVEPVSQKVHPVSQVFFPTGLANSQNQYILSFGEADQALGIAIFDKTELWSRLVPAQP